MCKLGRLRNHNLVISAILACMLAITAQAATLRAEGNEDLLGSVERLNGIITNGPESRIPAARSEIRAIMEEYFRSAGVELKSYELPFKHACPTC